MRTQPAGREVVDPDVAVVARGDDEPAVVGEGRVRNGCVEVHDALESGRAVDERGFEAAVGRERRLQPPSLDAEEQREVVLVRGQRPGQCRELRRLCECGGVVGARGLPVGVAALDERDGAGDERDDEQDGEPDR